MPRGCQSLRRKRFPIKHLDKKSRNFNLRSPAPAHPGAPRRHKPAWTAGAGPCPRLPHLPAHCRWHTDLHCASARWLGHCAVHCRLHSPGAAGPVDATQETGIFRCLAPAADAVGSVNLSFSFDGRFFIPVRNETGDGQASFAYFDPPFGAAENSALILTGSSADNAVTLPWDATSIANIRSCTWGRTVAWFRDTGVAPEAASVEALRLSLTRAGLLTCSSGLCARWV